MPIGSIAKLVIAAETLHQVDQGRLDPNQRITVRQQDIVGGTGILQNRAGSSFTITQLVEIMLRHSDNTAGNLLISHVGGFGPINAYCLELGMPDTRVNRRFLDTEAQARGVENVSSARDIALFLAKLNQGLVVGRAQSDFILRVLQDRGQTDRNWLLLDIPIEVPTAHITGILDGVRNDAALIGAPSGPYVLVILIRDADEKAAETTIRQTGAAVHSVMTASRR